MICAQEEGSDQDKHKITDVIGTEEDLGVENLKGSGLIAGETSVAYNDIFTLTVVLGRTVGIGAYLVRLGQRTIQKKSTSPIILTGYQALNKLMGCEVYSTNDQLGGPQIMGPNGVSHLLANNHFDAVLQALQWLSFVPAQRGGELPVSASAQRKLGQRCATDANDRRPRATTDARAPQPTPTTDARAPQPFSRLLRTLSLARFARLLSFASPL